MITKFVDEDSKCYDYEGEPLPILPRGTLVRGPWGSRRVVDSIVSIHSDKPVQTIMLGLVNIHER